MSRVFPLGDALREVQELSAREYPRSFGVELAEIKASRPPRGTRWKFPISYAHEDDASYRVDCAGTMKEWVLEVLAGDDDLPAEHYCLAYVEHYAIREVDRPLRDPERALVYSVVRDIRNAALTKRKHEELAKERGR